MPDDMNTTETPFVRDLFNRSIEYALSKQAPGLTLNPKDVSKVAWEHFEYLCDSNGVPRSALDSIRPAEMSKAAGAGGYGEADNRLVRDTETTYPKAG